MADPITGFSVYPSRKSPSTFSDDGDTFLSEMAAFVSETNTVATALNLLSTTSTSTTSLTIGTGAQSLTVDVSKSYVVGMTVKVAYTTTPTNWMLGTVTSYNSGTGALVVTVTDILGSGTQAVWTVTLSGPAGADGSSGNADLLGALHRPQFTFKDGDEIYISGGWYDIRGTATKLVQITSAITFVEGSGGSNSDSSDLTNAWHYIYIDYSAIPADNVLVAASFMNSVTAPTWDPAKGGWYGTAVGSLTVNDRCIFAVYGDATPDITEFNHSGETVMWADQIETQAAVDIDTAWTDIGAFRVPGFAKEVLACFTTAVQGDYWYWRTNGQTGATGHLIAYMANPMSTNGHVVVITDSSQIVEIKAGTSSAAQIIAYTNAWRFPIGM